MNNYTVYTFGEKIHIKADHFTVVAPQDEIWFFKSENERDERDETWTVFLHGVAAIKNHGPSKPVQTF